MSSRKPQQITLSPTAQQDFIDILRYTGETWGEKQLLAYRDKINEALQAINGNPQFGIAGMTCRRHTMPIWLDHTSLSTACAKME